MDFELSEDIKFLKQSIKDFIDSEVDPLAMEIEETDEIPEKIMNMSKEMGLFGLSILKSTVELGLEWLVSVPFMRN